MDDSSTPFSLRQIIMKTEGFLDSPDSTIKEKSEQFKEFCVLIGIDVDNLKNKSGEYCFYPKDVPFVKDFLKNYTAPPISDIRKCAFDVVDHTYFQAIEAFIVSVMTLNGKDRAEIEPQLDKIRDEIKWEYSEYKIGIKECTLNLNKAFDKHTCLGSQLSMDDKVYIAKMLHKKFKKLTSELIDWLEDIDFYFSSFRMHETLSTLPSEAIGYQGLVTIEQQLLPIFERLLPLSNTNDETLKNQRKCGNQPKICKLKSFEKNKANEIERELEARAKEFGLLPHQFKKCTIHRASSKKVFYTYVKRKYF